MSRLSVAILTALVFGWAIGTAIAGTGVAGPVAAVAAPIGQSWLDALTMTVVPLVFALLVTGVIAAVAHASGGVVALRALLWFAAMLLTTSLLCAAVTSGALLISPVPQAASALRPGSHEALVPQAQNWLAAIAPMNPVRAAAETAMVPLVFFALIFGFAASRIEPDLRASLARVFDAIAKTMLQIVQWVLVVAPIGVFSLALGVGIRTGAGGAGVLAHYVGIVVVAALATLLLAYGVVAVAGRMTPVAFARAALPSQAIALSTQSSLASLPAMVGASAALGIDRGAAGVVLPLAVSLFRATSAGANVAVAVYLAHVHGVSLDIGSLIAGAAIAAVVSIAAVGLPAQVSFFAIIAPVCIVMGVPVVLLPLLLAIETLPDLFRTVGNVTFDLAIARIVGRERGDPNGEPA
ncbi:MAG TPA: cation:dicarboxylase symporter family transporter [Sphingomonas sp.]